MYKSFEDIKYIKHAKIKSFSYISYLQMDKV